MLNTVQSIFPGLQEYLNKTSLFTSDREVQQLLTEYWSNINHGDFARWQSALDYLSSSELNLKRNWTIHNGHLTVSSRNSNNLEKIGKALEQFKPWRKGPMTIAGVLVDTEWHSDWKWQRIANHIQPLQGRNVLDVGCGNGYFGYHMLQAGASAVIGVDRMLLFAMQHQLIHALAGQPQNWVLPLTLEQLPATPQAFDSIFSLGVLYHRKEPVAHLQNLHKRLSQQGELILETFVLPPGSPAELHVDRYARMHNVYALPDTHRLFEWLQTAGFCNCRMVDICRTTTTEQRSTDWMSFESLEQALDSSDPTLTIEQHPAPVRATVIAEK